MNERTRFVGLDVHKASIAVAVADAFGEPEDHGQIANDPGAVRKLLARLGDGGVHLAVAYEAGPTGYALHRQVTAMGIACMVVAPSLIPVRPGDRIKTDLRDAAKLARLLRSGDLVAVWVPDETGEALRDLVRARADAKEDQLRAKHRLSKLLLRRAVHPPLGVRAWSRAHEAWLDKVTFAHPADQVVFEDYRAVVRAAAERVRRLEGALLRSGCRWPAGRDRHRAPGDPRHRLPLGCDDRRRGRRPAPLPHRPPVHGLRRPRPLGALQRVLAAPRPITKTGNRLMRHVLGQAAHNARYRPNVSSSLRARQSKVPRAVVELDRRAQARLHQRYRHLAGRIGTNKAITAVARELAGFVWAAGQLVDSPATA